MNRLTQHLRSNAIAYLALFVALGGTSYAATSLPAGSVGTRQLKNHSITPIKFDGTAIGGYVLYWAQIDQHGHVLDSMPQGASATRWNANPAFSVGGLVTWNKPIPKRCFSLATVNEPNPLVGGLTPATVDAGVVSGSARTAGALLELSEPAIVNVAVICPVE